MAHVTAEHTKEVRKRLKENFPGWKFSVTKQHHSGLCVSIMEAPVDLSLGADLNQRAAGECYYNVNHYYIKEHFDEPVRSWLTKVRDVANKGHWDESDPMSDYHNCSWYFYLSVGKWDKPFEYTGSGDRGTLN